MLATVWEIILTDIEIIILAMLPIIELRGAIPVALGYGLSLPAAFLLSYIGSILPALPILLLCRAVLRWMLLYPPFHRPASWLQRRLIKRRSSIDRYGLIGLLIFVAIPLPGTGVWSGSGLAALLELPRGRAFLAVAIGNLIAGIIITAISYPIFS